MKEKAKEKKSIRGVGREDKQQKQRSSGLEIQVSKLVLVVIVCSSNSTNVQWY